MNTSLDLGVHQKRRRERWRSRYGARFRCVFRAVSNVASRVSPAVEEHATVVDVSEWLATERDPERPWILCVNLTDVHFPYAPPWEHARPFFTTHQAWQTAVARVTALNPMNIIRLHYLGGLAEPLQRLRQLAGEPRTHPTRERGKAEPMDDETRQALGALGYLNPDGP